MSDILASIFRLANARGYHVPHMNVQLRAKPGPITRR